MRLLIDANLSPRIAEALREAGHDAVHVVDIDVVAATDDQILASAAHDNRVIVSADADFGALLAGDHLSKPSFVLLRSADHLSPGQQAALLIGNLTTIEAELAAGAIASIGRGRIRLRTLPMEYAPDT